MKRMVFIAIAVAAIMLATTVAQAADMSFSGQFRPRFQSNEDSDGSTSTRPNFDTRVRLNAKANINANTEVFLQFQSVGTWGNDGAEGDRDSSVTNDIVTDVGFHQAYLTFKNVAGKAVNAKIGRQEVVLDGHRLFGHTGWAQGAQTNDAIRLDHASGNHTMNYIYIASSEAGSLSTDVDSNYDIHIFRAATQGVLGGDIAGYFVINADESAETNSTDNNTWYTIGARQKGKMGGLDYRVEYYHQFGDGSVAAAAQTDFAAAYDNVTGSTALNSSAIDRDAYMFGMRVGKTFTNAKYSPTITLWYDVLSGQDDENALGSEMSSFNTQSDTGHKFYGLIDNFGGVGTNGTNNLGLQDLAVKVKFKLSDTNTFKADFHQFLTDTNLDDGDSDTLRSQATGAFATNGTTGAGVGAGLSDDLGQEIDLTLVHKYDANTKVVAGYSHYFTTVTHGFLNGSGSTAAGRAAMDDQDWFYVMVDTKF